MTSSLVVTLKSSRSQTDLADRFSCSSSTPHTAVQKLITFLEGANGGVEACSYDLQTGSTAPVAASGTWTLVSVVATDEADVGGVAFTFTASPSLETDVMVTVPTASVLASSTDINIANGKLTETAHGFVTGDVGRLTTSNALPTGFALSTDYFVIKVDADTYRLASSLANAQAGIYVHPTTTGTGNQTFTLTANTYKACQLANAVNAHSTISKIVSATYAANVVTVTARVKGVIGNFIQFTDQDSTITSSGSGYLAGGTGGATSDAVNYVFGL
jgi:hypothetical protein